MGMGTAFLTQLLSMFGIGAAINMMVWGWGVMFGGSIVSMVVAALWLWAYKNAMGVWKDDSDTNAATTQGADGDLAQDLTEAIEWDMMKMMVHEAAATLTAMEYHKTWAKAQWYALSPEEQVMWAAKHGQDGSGEDMDGMMGNMEQPSMMDSEETEDGDETEEAGEVDTPNPGFDDFFLLFKKNVFGF